MKFLLPQLAAAAAIITLCSSCATQSQTIPSAADLDRSHVRFRALAQPEFDDLEQRRSGGALSQVDYEREKAGLEYRVQQRAINSAWTAHALAESDRKATGIPTPDQPQQIQAGATQGSLYQSHNDAYGSNQGLGASSAMSGGGYQTGGNILGGARPAY